jgi:hypothetical protein
MRRLDCWQLMRRISGLSLLLNTGIRSFKVRKHVYVEMLMRYPFCTYKMDILQRIDSHFACFFVIYLAETA